MTIEHSGICGGDRGHGGFVHIRIEDIASTDLQVFGQESHSLDFRVQGDTERHTLTAALKAIVKELEENT